MARRKVIIMGAAGMDYHVFNTYFRDNPEYEVVGFTIAAEQNLGTTEGGGLRTYPPELAGKLYPEGIPTFYEENLEEVIEKTGAEEVVLAYSDISHEYVMHLASRALSAGANFRLIAPKHVMLKSKKPVLSVCAVRTGCGKSQTTRWIGLKLKEKGLKVVVVREPMPYGDLRKQIWQRFATLEDLKKYECTIEEMEEYEPHITHGLVVYAGVDYLEILKRAEEEADVILWDGGNNEISFFVPDLLIVVVDPLRPGHEIKYHPGEVNLRMADVIVINKENSAKEEKTQAVMDNIKKVNSKAKIVHANSVIKVHGDIEGKRVLVIEDGPTVTHGGMPYGAGYVVAKENNCEIIDPRPYAVGEIKKTFEEFHHLKNVLPAMGYSKRQLKELEETINTAECDLVVSGTPIDLNRIIKVNKPIVRVTYELEPKDALLEEVLDEFVRNVVTK